MNELELFKDLKEPSIVDESLNIVKTNLPNIITTILLSKKLNFKILISLIVSPLILNAIQFYLNFVDKKRKDKYILYLKDFKTADIVYNFFTNFNRVDVKNIHCGGKMGDVLYENSTGFYNRNIYKNIKIDILEEDLKTIKLINKKELYNEYFYLIHNKNSGYEFYLIGKNKSKVDILLQYIHTIQSKNQKIKYISFNKYENNEKKNDSFIEIDFCDIFLSKNSEIIFKLETFKNDKEYYIENKLPIKYSFLFWGEPGTGKTSIAQILCKYLGYTLVEFSLTSNTFDYISSNISSNSIVLFDEIDRIFDESENKNSKNTGIEIKNFLIQLLQSKKLNEVIFVFTTNKKPTDFDPALFRPGRIDHVEEFKFCDKDQFKLIYEKYVEQSLPDDFNFPENTYSPARLIYDYCIPYRKNPNLILEKLIKK